MQNQPQARSLGLPLFLLALLAAPLLPAKEPWREKPADQWTQEEAEAVVTDSPWAQRVTVMQVTGRTLGRMADGSKVVYREHSRAAPRRLSEEPQSLEPEVVRAVYLVRWSSSRTVQQALDRLAGFAEVLREIHAAPPELSDESIVVTVRVMEPPRESSMVAISRPTLVDEEGRRYRDQPARVKDIFAGLSAEELQARAELKTSDKGRLRPERVERHGVGTGAGVSFFFPRRNEGRATLAAKSQWAEFVFESEKGDKLKVRFKFKDMQAVGRPDY